MTIVISSYNPFWQFSVNGSPLVGGKLFTYAAGTSTLQATWTDSTGLTQNTNPILLNSRGETANSSGVSVGVWTPPGTAYKYVLQDSAGNIIDSIDNVIGPLTTPPVLTQAIIGGILYPPTTAEGATVVNDWYPYGNVLRYGTNTTPGVTDMTQAVKNALLFNQSVYIPSGSYLCSAPIPMLSGQTLHGDGDTSILTYTNPAIDNITLTNLTGATVRSLKIVVTGTGSTSATGAVHAINCTFCYVEDCEFVGMNWGGIWFDGGCLNCEALRNYCHGFQTAANIDAPHITAYNTQTVGTNCASYCIIRGNWCIGNAAVGVDINEAHSATSSGNFPYGNIVDANVCTGQNAYGILLYMPGNGGTPPPATDTHNHIVNNVVDGVTGSAPTNPSSGAGIYAVGLGTGGTIIANNTVRNCCISTVDRQLAPAGIGINGSSGPTPIQIVGNTISGMTQGDGILATACTVAPIIVGGSINIPSTNNGTGAGGSLLAGSCVRIEASSGAMVESVKGVSAGTGSCVFVYANGVNCQDVTFTGGSYVGTGAASPFRVVQVGGFTVNNLSVTGTRIQTSNTSANALQLSAIVGATLTGIIATSTSSQVTLVINGSTQVRVSGGSYTGGSDTLQTVGTCTGGYVDRSTYLGASASLIANGATGFQIEWTSTASPATGTWAVGDSVYNSAPSAAGVFIWVCTAAGTPGTWKTISNT